PDGARRERSPRDAARCARGLTRPEWSGWSGRASRSTSGPYAGTRPRSSVQPGEQSSGPSSRPTGTATAGSMCRAGRSPAAAAARSGVPPEGALAGGASALCIATVQEALELRAAFRDARIVVMGPVSDPEVAEARSAGFELVATDGRLPEGVRLHLKLDTGMGRWGLSELPAPTRDVVGLMSHLASAEADPAFTQLQVDRFREATAQLGSLTRHVANSAATLRYAEARFDGGRCGIALSGASPCGLPLHGVPPFGADRAEEGLEPALRWESYVALVKRLEPGESTGYGRRFVADRPTWIGVVPVGYADGFRRDMSGTDVLVQGARRRVVGAVSMDALAVVLDDAIPV